jgi:ribokinase
VTRRVLVIGDAMLDVVVRPLAPVAPTSDTPSRVRVGRGGSAANLAVALRLAAGDEFEVVFAGIAGEDAAAHIVRSDLEESGVIAHLSTAPGATGVVVSLVDTNGERAMMTERGVNGELELRHVSMLFDDSLIHVHVSGYTALDERTRVLVHELWSRATAVGASTSIDVCSVGPLLQMGVGAFTQSALGATILFANEEEALVLSGESDVERALLTLGARWREVVVTRGAQGAMVRHDEEDFIVPALAGDVVDTTGAGDSATGTYLAHRLMGVDVTTALTHAMEAGARVVGRLGSRG